MATVTDWVDDIQRDFPEALDSVIERAVRQALQEFCKASEAWLHHETITLVEGQREYPLSQLPFDTYAIAGRYCYLNHSNSNRYKLTATLKGRIDPTAQGQPSMFAVERYSVFLDGTPRSGNIELCVVLQPTRSISEVDESFSDSWYDDIRKGAIAQLLMMPGKPWTDIQTAVGYENLAREAALRAKRESRNDRSRPKRAVRFNPDFHW